MGIGMMRFHWESCRQKITKVEH